MSLPGFSAETSLYETNACYRTASAGISDAGVIPQQSAAQVACIGGCLALYGVCGAGCVALSLAAAKLYPGLARPVLVSCLGGCTIGLGWCLRQCYPPAPPAPAAPVPSCCQCAGGTLFAPTCFPGCKTDAGCEALCRSQGYELGNCYSGSCVTSPRGLSYCDGVRTPA
jgi:hypothetical protein